MQILSSQLPGGRKYDVSLSFAGEDRPYVGQVASFLRGAGVRVFYDEYEETALWGKDLIDELDQIFRLESEVVVMFVSAAYRNKDWTNHERRSVLAAALKARREYILPVRFDETELPGMPATMKWLDARKLSPRLLGERVLAKLSALGLAGACSDKPLAPSPGIVAWRIARADRAPASLAGSAVAASITGGRWNPAGVLMLYSGASFCTSLLELLVHAQNGLLDGWVTVQIRIPATVAIETIYESALPTDWREVSRYKTLQQLGAAWVQSGRTCVMSVPSAAVPNERMFLMNPLHPDFSELEVLALEPLRIDSRLLR